MRKDLNSEAAGLPHDVLANGRFRQILEAMPDGLVIVDGEGTITLVNRQTERMFGYTRAELVGQKIEMLVPERSRGVHPQYRGEYAEHPRMRPMGAGLRLFARRHDGTEFSCEISLSPLDLGEGWLTVAAVRDITERVQAQEREKLLEKERTARTEAEHAVALRDEFLSIASHELRTPLTAMLMRLQLLIRQSEKGRLAPELAEVLELPLRSAKRLATLVDQLLDVTRISSGRLVLDRKPTDLVRVVRGALEQQKSQLGAKAPPMELAAPATVEAVVDTGRIEQVISNLLGNAVKYGEGKPIDVSVAAEDGQARIDVRDQGIGIGPEQQERIFERFERAVAESSYEGLGLGLYIAKQIVEAHGGAISVASRFGDGAVFTVRLPREAR